MRGLLILLITCLILHAATAQDSSPPLEKLINSHTHFTDHINKKADQPEGKMVCQTEKHLLRLAKKRRKTPEEFNKSN